jgi:signal transduction histidine kinase
LHAFSGTSKVAAINRVLIFDADPGRAASIASLLEHAPPWAGEGSVLVFSDLNARDHGPSPAMIEIQAGLPTLLVLVESAESSTALNRLAELARRQGVATLLVVSEVGDLERLVSRVGGFDDWMALESVDRELPGRVAVMLDRSREKWASRARLAAIDSRFLAVVIHDLRTPLNVIGLTIRAITQSVPSANAMFDEDLRFLQDNSNQIKEMLELLSDYCKLMDVESLRPGVEFDPRRFLSDFFEDRRERSNLGSPPIRLEIADSCPSVVTLDPPRAFLALKLAFENSVVAAGKAPVRIRSRGEADRWIIELIVESPPPRSIASLPLRSDSFERVTGASAERRGLDLAIVARISELFGGMAQFVVEPDRRSTLVIDWPRRLAQA